MNNRIEYKNIPLGATENSTATSDDVQQFVNMADLKRDKIVPLSATLEKNRWSLDGNFKEFPDNPVDQGFISLSMSNADGEFEEPVVITRVYDKTYTSPGIGIIFDTNLDEYSTSINIAWYRDDALITSEDYAPDSSSYFCANDVVAYNKIVITFRTTSKPYRYLRVFKIEDGMIRNFYNDELKNLKIIEEVSSTTETLSMNTLDFEIITKNNIGILFQKTLPLTLYRNENLIGSFFIDSAERENQKDYKVSTSDYIGLLDRETYMGGMYTSTPLSEIVSEILGDISYDIDSELASRTITGYLGIKTKREALQEVIFSAGGIIDCSRSNKINITTLSDTIVSILGNDKIVSIKESYEAIVTSIELTEHKYKIKRDSTTIIEEQMNGENLIMFGSPYSNLTITNGTILESGVNYARIFGNGNVVLTGKEYDDIEFTKIKSNPLTVSTDLPNVRKYNSTLICNEISLLNYLKFKSKELEIKFRLTTEKVGDKISILGETARIISLIYELETKNIYATAKLEIAE